MKKLLLILLTGILVSCSAIKQHISTPEEDELLFTRKYIGDFLECYHAGPEVSDGVNLVWIKTTSFPVYGQLSVYGKSCEFSPGDRLYLRSRYLTDGSFGNWEYFVESESALFYRLSEFRNEDKVLVQRMVK